MYVILTMAMSANGIIATETGSEDFLSNTNWRQFVQLAHETGNFIYGRKTYEAVLTWDESYLHQVEGITKIVLSKTIFKPQKDFIPASSPQEALRILETLGFSKAYITGGATVNSEFAKANLIDEIRLDVNPILLGKGVPLFAPADWRLKIRLVDTQQLEDDIVELRYIVEK